MHDYLKIEIGKSQLPPMTGKRQETVANLLSVYIEVPRYSIDTKSTVIDVFRYTEYTCM